MDSGAFSVNLSVRDIRLSENFHNTLGFQTTGVEAAQNWLIEQNGDHTTGLFQGMFEKNMLTFDPGWGQHAEKLENSTDIHDLQRAMRKAGIEPAEPVDEMKQGPANMVTLDPDGKPILIDQHR